MEDDIIDEEIAEEMEEFSDIGKQEEKTNKEVRECLKDVKFPIKKSPLAKIAKKKCSPEIAKMIENSVVEEFHDITEVEEEVI